MDLGPCPRAHQEKLQLEFARANEANPDDPAVVAIENEWQRAIHEFVEDCDRKISMSQRRLEKTPEENAKTTALVSRPFFILSCRCGWGADLFSFALRR